MPVTVIVGGQFGSEGKGKAAAHLALTGNPAVSVRCGGPNSGHTVHHRGKVYRLRQVPAAFLNPRTKLLVPAGALVDPGVLLQETELCRLGPERLGIDPNTGIVEPRDGESEQELALGERLGSTGSGTGAATSRRVMREPDFRTAQDCPQLAPFVTNVRDELARALAQGEEIIVEGTQGFGLSLYHTGRWPYCTSKDTTAHSFLSEAGIGARSFRVLMCLRAFPIRVAGNSGPLPLETGWETLRRESGSPEPLAEFTTVTGRLRRVGRFDWDLVQEAVLANAPDQLALHGADQLDHRNRGVTGWDELTSGVKKFVQELENRLSVPVALVGTGPEQQHMVDRR